jgi:hypothetical protein
LSTRRRGEQAAQILSGLGNRQGLHRVAGLRRQGPGRSETSIGKGRWELCDGPDFTGRCVTLENSVANLRTYNIGSRIASLRPLFRQQCEKKDGRSCS